MIPFSDSAVEKVFESYPEGVREKMLVLRDLIFTTGQGIGEGNGLTETLKWGEPSYLCQNGSTVRLNWKEDDPEHYRVCFHCQTSLIPTFRLLYPDAFDFDGNRAIRIKLSRDPDLERLGHCIELSLNYHLLKGQPMLGAKPVTRREPQSE